MKSTRRDFLKGLGSLAVCASVVPIAPAAEVETVEVLGSVMIPESTAQAGALGPLMDHGGLLTPMQAERFIRKLLAEPMLVSGEMKTVEMTKDVRCSAIEVHSTWEVPRRDWEAYEAANFGGEGW